MAAADERPLRQHQGRPRGASRRRRHLHGRRAGHDRPRRLADDGVPDCPTAGRSSAAPTSRSGAAPCQLPDCCGRSTTRGATGAPSCSSRPSSSPRRSAARRPDDARAVDDAARHRRAQRRAAAARARSSTPSGAASARAPKFPQTMSLELLLRAHAHNGAPTRLARRHHLARRHGVGRHLRPPRRRVRPLLGRRAWLVPHFEKMLYDQALLARVYLHAWQVTGEAALPPGGRRDDRLRAARPAPAARAASPRPRTPTPRATERRAASTSGRSTEIAAVLGADARRRPPIEWYGVTEDGQLRGSQHPAPPGAR